MKKKVLHFCGRCKRRIIKQRNGAWKHCLGGSSRPLKCAGPVFRQPHLVRRATAPLGTQENPE